MIGAFRRGHRRNPAQATPPGARMGVLALGVALLAASGALKAHLITYRGTVAKIEAARVQVRTIDSAGKEEPTPRWFSPNPQTKVLRGETRISFAEARITVGERIAVVVDHRSDEDAPVVEIRLAPR